MADITEAELTNESDRGCLLVGAAILESRLEDIFAKVFNGNYVTKTVQKSLFDSNGALATFSSKITVAYSFGLISKTLYEDLHAIRKMRNEAAHSSQEIDFVGSGLTERIESLHYAKKYIGRIQRFSYSNKVNGAKSDDPVRVGPKVIEATLRTKGFVKYAKSLFALTVKCLEIDIVKHSALTS